MKIKRLVETKEGPVEFTAELTQEQLQFILGVGINFLIKNGVEFFNKKVIVPGPDTVQ